MDSIEMECEFVLLKRMGLDSIGATWNYWWGEWMLEWVGVLKRGGCWRGSEWTLERVGVDVVVGYAIRNYWVGNY